MTHHTLTDAELRKLCELVIKPNPAEFHLALVLAEKTLQRLDKEAAPDKPHEVRLGRDGAYCPQNAAELAYVLGIDPPKPTPEAPEEDVDAIKWLESHAESGNTLSQRFAPIILNHLRSRQAPQPMVAERERLAECLRDEMPWAYTQEMATGKASSVASALLSSGAVVPMPTRAQVLATLETLQFTSWDKVADTIFTLFQISARGEG